MTFDSLQKNDEIHFQSSCFKIGEILLLLLLHAFKQRNSLSYSLSISLTSKVTSMVEAKKFLHSFIKLNCKQLWSLGSSIKVKSSQHSNNFGNFVPFVSDQQTSNYSKTKSFLSKFNMLKDSVNWFNLSYHHLNLFKVNQLNQHYYSSKISNFSNLQKRHEFDPHYSTS